MHSQDHPPHTIESDDPRVTRDGTWLVQAANGASGGAYLYSTGHDADGLTLVFSGTTIEIWYIAGPHLGILALEVDGTVLRTVITTADQTAYHQTTTLNYLTDETHTLRVYAQEDGVVAVDAFVARLPIKDEDGGIHAANTGDGQIVFVCPTGICVVNPTDTDPYSIPNTGGLSPAWSPNGQQIAFVYNSSIYIVRRTGSQWGAMEPLATLATSDAGSLAWSPDGKRIVYSGYTLPSYSGTLYIVDLTECDTSHVCATEALADDDDPSTSDAGPAWSPNGQFIVFARGQNGTSHLYSIDVSFEPDQQEATPLSYMPLPDDDYYHSPAWSPDGSQLAVVLQHDFLDTEIALLDAANYPQLGPSISYIPQPPQEQQEAWPFPLTDSKPTWSSDGSQMAFSRFCVFIPDWTAPDCNQFYDYGANVVVISLIDIEVEHIYFGSSPHWRLTNSCIVPSPGDADFYRAPIGYNPYEGILSFTSSYYDFELDAQFTEDISEPIEGQEETTTTWYRVARILQHGTQQPPPPGDIPGNMAQAVQQNGGVWIKATEWLVGLPGCVTDSLRVAHEYDIPNIPWNSFSGFSSLPVSIADICAAERQEIHALGFPEPQEIYPEREDSPAFYPRDLHGGVDFFVPTTAGTGNVVSVGDGIVVGIGVGYVIGIEKFPISDSHHIWGAYETNEATGPDVANEPDEPGEYSYAVIVRYGHLYVLYGHILYLSDDIWVGSHVRPGQFIGALGTSGTRHLHIEVHNFQEDRGQLGYDLMDETGILPYGSDFRHEGAPFLYDFLQLFNDQAISSAVATDNLGEVQTPLFDNQGNATIYFTDGNVACSITYITRHPDDPVINEDAAGDGFRLFPTSAEYDNERPSPLDFPDGIHN